MTDEKKPDSIIEQDLIDAQPEANVIEPVLEVVEELEGAVAPV